MPAARVHSFYKSEPHPIQPPGVALAAGMGVKVGRAVGVAVGVGLMYQRSVAVGVRVGGNTGDGVIITSSG
jgi:hypothetical protein